MLLKEASCRIKRGYMSLRANDTAEEPIVAEDAPSALSPNGQSAALMESSPSFKGVTQQPAAWEPREHVSVRDRLEPMRLGRPADEDEGTTLEDGADARDNPYSFDEYTSDSSGRVTFQNASPASGQDTFQNASPASQVEEPYEEAYRDPLEQKMEARRLALEARLAQQRADMEERLSPVAGAGIGGVGGSRGSDGSENTYSSYGTQEFGYTQEFSAEYDSYTEDEAGTAGESTSPDSQRSRETFPTSTSAPLRSIRATEGRVVPTQSQEAGAPSRQSGTMDPRGGARPPRKAAATQSRRPQAQPGAHVQAARDSRRRNMISAYDDAIR